MTADQDRQEDEHAIEIENAARDRHQLRTLAVAVTAIAIVFSAIGAAIVYAMPLDKLWFLHFPVGYYLLAQGLLFFTIFIGFWYVRVQERIDHTRSVNEEIA